MEIKAKIKSVFEDICSHTEVDPQAMDIVDMAIHPVVCQKSDFHKNSDFRNFQKLDHLQIPAKTISGQNMLSYQRYFEARN